MEITDPTVDGKLLVVGDDFYKAFYILNKKCAILPPLIFIVIELESIINPRNSIFWVAIKTNFFWCTANPVFNSKLTVALILFMHSCSVFSCKWELSINMTDRQPCCLSVQNWFWNFSENYHSIKVTIWHTNKIVKLLFPFQQVVYRHCEESIFQIKTGNFTPCF